ncbi:MAG: MerR family transcriptional regulator [Planctomycetota bacterium]
MPDKDYYSFDEVLKNLELEEDELKRLVSAGEIRAFRDKDTMRFKAEDVVRLQGDQGVEEDLALDDLELELEDDLEPAPIAVEADADETLLLEEPGEVDELLLEEEPLAEGGVEELDLGAAPDEPAAAPGPRPGRAKAAAGPARRPARAAAVSTEEVSDSVGTIAMLVVGIVLLVIANFLIFDAVTGRASNPLSRAVANMFG